MHLKIKTGVYLLAEYAKFDFAAVYGHAWVCRVNAPGAYSDGRPKGLPYPISEGFLENRRGGAEGESAEGREKSPWGVPLRKQHGRNHIRRRGDPCGRLYSRCESWREPQGAPLPKPGRHH